MLDGRPWFSAQWARYDRCKTQHVAERNIGEAAPNSPSVGFGGLAYLVQTPCRGGGRMGCDSKLRFRYRRGSRILLADSTPQTRQGLVRGLLGRRASGRSPPLQPLCMGFAQGGPNTKCDRSSVRGSLPDVSSCNVPRFATVVAGPSEPSGPTARRVDVPDPGAVRPLLAT